MPSLPAETLPQSPLMLWSQEFIDALSLARHREIARRIQADLSLLNVARGNAARWLAGGNYDDGEAASVKEWLPLLDEERVGELIETLESPSENATRMRQSSPFAGILPKEVYRRLREELILDWSNREA